MNYFFRLAILTLAAAAAWPATAPVQAPTDAVKPNFSGRWRMDKAKSDFGGFQVPDIVVQAVEHHDPTMNVHTVETVGKNTSTVDVSYFTDGTISSNIIKGRQAESKAFWDGKVLNVRTSGKSSKGEDVVIEDRWELSDDGDTLIRTSHIITTKGSVDMKLVAAKEKSGN